MPVQPPLNSPRIVQFSAFEVNFETGELRKNGRRVRLQEQPLLVLRALVEHPGEVVSREELVRRLWPDGIYVDFDRGLNAAVTRLRRALCDSADTPRYIETVPRRGYRFLAPIATISDATQERDIAPRAGRIAEVVPENRDGGKWKVWAVALSLAIAAIAAGFALLHAGANADLKMEQITRDKGLAKDPAFSPDGKLLAYASDRGGQSLHI